MNPRQEKKYWSQLFADLIAQQFGAVHYPDAGVETLLGAGINFFAQLLIRCREGGSHFPIPMCSFGILDLSICFVLMVMIHCQDKRANR